MGLMFTKTLSVFDFLADCVHFDFQKDETKSTCSPTRLSPDNVCSWLKREVPLAAQIGQLAILTDTGYIHRTQSQGGGRQTSSV